jgi:hypothetical protein
MVHRLPNRGLIEVIAVHKRTATADNKMLQRLQVRLINTQLGQRMLPTR